MRQEAALLRLQGVEKHYGHQKVLKIGELSLPARRSILLHGRNASGKSTLLRIVGGISTADEGSVWRHPVLEHRRLGFLPQAGGLYADLTLEQNLGLRRRLFDLPEINLHELWYIDELGLVPFLDRQVAQLSGGFTRLAAMAATLHGEPDWLLLDEPLSGVDDRARQVLKKRLKALAGRLDLLIMAAPSIDQDLGADLRVEIKGGQIQ